MKRAISLLLAFIMCVSFCACETERSEDSESLSDRVASEVKAQIMFHVGLSYEIVGAPRVTAFVKEIGDNEFRVTGKVTIRDNYGDTYTGKYDATASYDEDSDNISVDYDIGELYKE